MKWYTNFNISIVMWAAQFFQGKSQKILIEKM